MYKIIKIIDEYNVVVDYGLGDRAIEGDILDVYVPGKEVIVEDENYGTLDFIKAQLVVKNVYPKMSLCENRSKTSTYAPFLGINLAKAVPLKICDAQKENLIGDNIDKTLRIGDLVRKKSIS